MKFQPIEAVHNAEWGDEQYRARFSVEAFRHIEANTPVDTLFYYWDTLRKGHGASPLLGSFRPFEIFPQAVLDSISWVEVDDENAENFVLRNHHGGTMQDVYGSVEGLRFRDYPNRIHRRETIRDYQLCKKLKRPLYHDINQVLDGACRRYTRIMMPLCDAKGDVVQIAYGLRRKPLFPAVERVTA